VSYCRWSSNDFDCDVYVYAHVDGGWRTHVAARRHVVDRAGLPPVDGDDLDAAWFARLREVMRRMKGAPLEPIGLPHDGADFTDPTPGACADRLESLRALGYRVPQFAIDALREEHTAEAR
jgi:hypothetical protein